MRDRLARATPTKLAERHGEFLEICWGTPRAVLYPWPQMIYTFRSTSSWTLATVELRAGGKAVGLEPQVFALLALLVENSERLVSKDEIIEKVWDGRVVSDAAVASRVKSARQALGDDGKSQQFIKTIHGQGYRFVAQARVARSAATLRFAESRQRSNPRDSSATWCSALDRIARPSLAVLPFRFVGADQRYAALASALPDELITDLSRLRWLFVTARGSSFRLRAPDADFGEIGRLLRRALLPVGHGRDRGSRHRS